MKIHAPCMDCPNRYPRCHSACEKYTAYVKKNDEENKLNHQTSLEFIEMKTTKQKAQIARWKQLHPFKRNK